MHKNYVNKIKACFDIIALIVGCVTLMSLIIWGSESQYQAVGECLQYLSGLIGLVYIGYAVHLWFWKRVNFDWNLIHGHFLRKVVCLVLLMPFVLSSIISVASYFCPDGFLFQQILEKGDPKDGPLFWNLYLNFMDPGIQSYASTPVARGVFAVIAILGVFLLNGLLVSSIIGWIDKRKENWQSGQLRYPNVRFLGKHKFAVVIGANEIAASVIKNLFSKKEKGEINYKCEAANDYVILQTKRDVQKVRNELSAHLSEEDLGRVVIYNALRDSVADIEDLHLPYCTEIYVLGESVMADGGETYHDALNMRCVNLIARSVSRNRNTRKVCKVMFEYQTTSSVFQFSDLSNTVKENLVFIPFNRYESWARKVIVDGVCKNEEEIIEYLPLEGEGIAADSSEFVHLVIVGMSKMGVSMGVQALLQAHYLNSHKARTRITFIDANADAEMAFFKGRYDNLFELVRTRYIDASAASVSSSSSSAAATYVSPLYAAPWTDPVECAGSKWRHLSEGGRNFLDVEVEFINGAVESDGVRECLKEISRNSDAKVTIAVCLTCTHQSVAASLYMPIEVYKNPRLQQILVYQQEAADIVLNLNNAGSDLRYSKLKPFGMLYGEYMSDRTMYLKAMLVNVAYDITNGYNKIGWPADISDRNDVNSVKARRSWRELSVDKKWSNKYFADSIYIKIRNIMLGERYFSSASLMKYLFMNNASRGFKALEEAIANNSEALARCEHNRWNIQQLILGYSPCDEELDKIFELRNTEGKRSPKVKEEYLKWKEQALNVSGDINRLGDIKDDVKECELRIHPNLCSYDHLMKVDSGARQYDTDLNNAILRIITIVDGYKF